MSNKKSNKNQGKKTLSDSKLGEPADHQVVHTEQRIEQFSGPIPIPDILARYNEIIPNAAERILVMAESDAKHRRDIEMVAINAQRRERHLGQILGFSIGLFALATSAFALSLGHSVAASVIGGTTVVGLVAVFVTGRIVFNRPKELPNNVIKPTA